MVDGGGYPSDLVVIRWGSGRKVGKEFEYLKIIIQLFVIN